MRAVVGIERRVRQPALVVFLGFFGKGQVVGFARQVLATTDEGQGVLNARVAFGNAGRDQGLDKELRVGQVGSRLGVVTGTAELDVLPGRVLVLELLEVGGGVLQDGVVLPL